MNRLYRAKRDTALAVFQEYDGFYDLHLIDHGGVEMLDVFWLHEPPRSAPKLVPVEGPYIPKAYNILVRHHHYSKMIDLPSLPAETVRYGLEMAMPEEVDAISV